MAEPKFEKDLERLEQIVEALETGGLPLDDALKRFEEGIKLARRCEKALSEAERKIEILKKNADGELTAEPFDDEAAENGDAKKPAPRKAKDGEHNTEVPPTGLIGGDRPATDSSAGMIPAQLPATDDEDEGGGLLF